MKQTLTDMTTTTLTYSEKIHGCRIETAIDRKKAVSNRLISICGKYYTVDTSDGERLEFVGKRAFDKWAKSNEYMTDF